MVAHATIIPFTPRQTDAMQAATSKPARGGKRAPLPRFDIHIPTWTKYQKGQAQRYARVERATKHNRQLSAMPAQYRWVWLSLVLTADSEGWVRQITVKDVAFEAEVTDLRMVRSALEMMADVGLIQCTDLARILHDQSTPKAHPKQEQSTSEAKCFDLSSHDAAFSDTEQNRVEQNRTEQKTVPPEPAPAPAVASTRQIDWDDQLSKATKWLAETLPEIADDLLTYFNGKIPASSRPAQYVAERIAEVKAQAAPKKGPAPPRDVLIYGWREAIRKGAGAPYAAKVIETKIQEAFSARTATPNRANQLHGHPQDADRPSRQPGSIYDVKL